MHGQNINFSYEINLSMQVLPQVDNDSRGQRNLKINDENKSNCKNKVIK